MNFLLGFDDSYGPFQLEIFYDSMTVFPLLWK